MPQRGERRQRTPPASPAVDEQTLDHVGVRVVQIDTRKSYARSLVNPADYQCQTLVGQLADEWVAYSRRASLRDSSRYSQAIRGFATFLDSFVVGRGQDPSLARLDGTAIKLPEVIDEWETSLRNAYSATSTQPYHLVNCLLVLISERGVRDEPVTDLLKARAAAPPLFKKAMTQVLDEFSNAERIALRRVAREDTRALEQRLEKGRRLLEQGADPRSVPDGWRQLPNLVWAAHNRILTTTALKAHLTKRVRKWPDQLRELAESEGRPGADNLMRAVGRLLFPNELDLHPFRVLMLLAADCTPEELHDLWLSDIEFTDGGVRLVQSKNRAHRIRTQLHRDQPLAEDTDEDAPPSDSHYTGSGRWDVPGLLRRVMAATELARSTFPAEPWLWLAVEIGNDRTELGAGLARFTRNRRRFTHWIASHQDDNAPLVVSEPHDARRLRKTAKTSRVVALGGTVTDLAGDDHHVEVFRGHYAHGTTAHVLSGKAINRAQEKVFQRITSKPLFIDDEAEDQLAEPEVAEAVGMTTEQARAMKAGEMDMGVTNCRNPNDSPYTPDGKFCHVAPAMCMLCRNAVVFTAQIPRLLLLADHIDHMRTVLEPPRWKAAWGKQSDALTQLFSEVGQPRIDKARQQIIDQDLHLDLPLGMRTEYDR